MIRAALFVFGLVQMSPDAEALGRGRDGHSGCPREFNSDVGRILQLGLRLRDLLIRAIQVQRHKCEHAVIAGTAFITELRAVGGRL
jgi:hypothetical protein